jgi:FkbM family methyltransferase
MLKNYFKLTRKRAVTKVGLIKKRIGNHLMYLNPNDVGISKSLLNLKQNVDREAAFMKVLRQEVKKGMTVVEVGANIGYVTLIIAELIEKTGKLYAFEPEPRNFKLLKMNIEANNYTDTVVPLQKGISNINGKAPFYISESSNLHSMIKTNHMKSSIDIELITLDEFLADKGIPNFVKMDIEGQEVEALEGMYTTLKRAPSPIKLLMEVHPMYYSETHSLEKQLRRLLSIGFNATYVISAGIPNPDFFVDRGYSPVETLRTDNWERGIYRDISNEDMIEAVCSEHKQFIPQINDYTKKIVRAIMIEK